MSDDIKKSTFQWVDMKATIFGGSWAKDMPFPSFTCNDIKLQAFDFMKAIDIYFGVACLQHLPFKLNTSDKSFTKI